jgi:DNA-binding MarR family transcriptional regulator
MHAKAQPTQDNAPREFSVEPLRHIIGFHIGQAQLLVQRHVSDCLAHLDLTPKQVAVLWLIDEYPGIAQIDLAELLQIDRNTMMGIVNRLEKRGFINREPGEADKRRQTLLIPPEGMLALRQAREAIAGHEEWLKQRFNRREADQLIKLLERIHRQA